MKYLSQIIAIAILLSSTAGVMAETISDHALWNIKSEPGETRWVQIREFSRLGNEFIYHVDVYQRRNGDEQELAIRLADHIAIEREALLNSIGQAVEVGVPELEAYQNALTMWVKTPTSQRKICRRPIQLCL